MVETSTQTTLRTEIAEWFGANPPRDGVYVAGNTGAVIGTAINDRDENQDRAVVVEFTSDLRDRSFKLFAVLDGMGGMMDGSQCAEAAAATIISSLVFLPRGRNRITLLEALTVANREVWNSYRGRGGATFAGVFCERGVTRSINLGDSRVYRLAPSRDLIQLSSDHRLGDQFAKLAGVERADLNPEIADRLGQYLGMSGLAAPCVRVVDESAPSPQTAVLVTTDGAHGVGDEGMSGAFRVGGSLEEIAKYILRLSALPGRDNATLVYCRTEALRETTRVPAEGYEHLRIWSAQGCFQFILPREEANSIGRTRGGATREKRGKSHQTPKSVKKNLLENLPQEDATSPKDVAPPIETHSEKTKEQPVEASPPKSEQPTDQDSGQSPEDRPSDEDEQRKLRDRQLGKPEVVVQQLTFDTERTDESSK